MNSSQIKAIVVKFIRNKVSDSGLDGVVVGLSGGIDSAVVAKLAVEALGKKRVMGILIPENEHVINDQPSTPWLEQLHKDFKDAQLFAETIGITYHVIPLSTFLNPNYLRCWEGCIPNERQRLRVGNISARARMVILYDQAADRKSLVIGTTNKSELMLGYLTKYGDGGVDIEPIADLYKTEVFKLARYLNIPETIINKPPSANLWLDQTDEAELGVSYSDADKILWWLIEEGYDPTRFVEDIPKLTGITDVRVLHKIIDLMSKNRHKRHMPETVKIGNLDMRRIRFNR